MKYFLSLTIKTIHPFDIFLIDTDLFLLKLTIFKDSKGIAQNVFTDILISICPENFSLQYQSGF